MIRELKNRHVFRMMLLKTDLCSEKKFPYEKRLTKSKALIPSLWNEQQVCGPGSGQAGIWLSPAAKFFFPWASLICDKTALKALIAFFRSCEGDRMIDVPRRGIICLDSQIEKINHVGPRLIPSWKGFKRSLSGGIHLSLSLPRPLCLPLSGSLSLSVPPQLPESACPGCPPVTTVAVYSVTLGSCFGTALSFGSTIPVFEGCQAASERAGWVLGLHHH